MRGAETADTGSTWDAALAGWDESPAAALLRGYSDAVNGRLLADWLEPGAGRVLKTDLFDEAVGAGLVPTLRERAERVVGIDVSPAVVAAGPPPLPRARGALRRYAQAPVRRGLVRRRRLELDAGPLRRRRPDR